MAFALIMTTALAVQVGTFLFSGLVMVLRCRTPGQKPRVDGEPTTYVVSIAALSVREADIALDALRFAPEGARVLFCAYDAQEPAARHVAQALALRPPTDTRAIELLCGRATWSENPKFDNIEKGYVASETDRVVFVDGNLRLGPDFGARVDEVWTDRVTAVSTTPLATERIGLWSEVEGAVLNLSHARWLLAGDLIGIRYAHGKLLGVRKSWLDAHGGLAALRDKAGEDTALSLLVQRTGGTLRHVRRPFETPLGRRSARAVLSRNLRWRRLRTGDVPGVYLSEALNPLWSMLVVGALTAGAWGLPVWPAIAGLALFWHICEGVIVAASGLGWSPLAQLGILLRDVSEPVLWVMGWRRVRTRWREDQVD